MRMCTWQLKWWHAHVHVAAQMARKGRAGVLAPRARADRHWARPGGGRSWPERWRGTAFVHLVHNLEPGYDGALNEEIH